MDKSNDKDEVLHNIADNPRNNSNSDNKGEEFISCFVEVGHKELNLKDDFDCDGFENKKYYVDVEYRDGMMIHMEC